MKDNPDNEDGVDIFWWLRWPFIFNTDQPWGSGET